METLGKLKTLLASIYSKENTYASNAFNETFQATETNNTFVANHPLIIPAQASTSCTKEGKEKEEKSFYFHQFGETRVARTNCGIDQKI